MFLHIQLYFVSVKCWISLQQTLVIKDFVVDHAVDLLGIMETWLHLKGDDVTIGELCPSGYRFVHTPGLVGVWDFSKNKAFVPAFF